MFRACIPLLLVLTPVAAFAVTDPGDAPPTPTETTQDCSDGQIWDNESQSCVTPQDARLDDDVRYKAAREFAWAGQYQDALGALAAMSETDSDRVLTYRGFVARKGGDFEQGRAFYQAALDKNPDNLLARAYLGMGYVEQGDLTAARRQLEEIRLRGGGDSWPETALADAITHGALSSY